MNDPTTQTHGAYMSSQAQLGGPLDVQLNWVTPEADQRIGHMARVSNPSATMDTPSFKLINYLLRKSHWSPFQMANMCLEVHTTRDISAQILRHASMAFQEFSTRYAAVEELQRTKECRFQDDKNRQNSWTADQMRANHGKNTMDINGFGLEDTVLWWDRVVNNHAMVSEGLYSEALDRGVAKEVARVLLPIGLVPTTMYINGSIRSWIHYIALRNDVATQKEHRIIAAGAYDIMLFNLPDTTAAFDIWAETNRRKSVLYELFFEKDGEAADLMSDAMTDVHDMDTGVNDFAKAAIAAVIKEVMGT